MSQAYSLLCLELGRLATSRAGAACFIYLEFIQAALYDMASRGARAPPGARP